MGARRGPTRRRRTDDAAVPGRGRRSDGADAASRLGVVTRVGGVGRRRARLRGRQSAGPVAATAPPRRGRLPRGLLALAARHRDRHGRPRARVRRAHPRVLRVRGALPPGLGGCGDRPAGRGRVRRHALDVHGRDLAAHRGLLRRVARHQRHASSREPVASARRHRAPARRDPHRLPHPARQPTWPRRAAAASCPRRLRRDLRPRPLQARQRHASATPPGDLVLERFGLDGLRVACADATTQPASAARSSSLVLAPRTRPGAGADRRSARCAPSGPDALRRSRSPRGVASCSGEPRRRRRPSPRPTPRCTWPSATGATASRSPRGTRTGARPARPVASAGAPEVENNRRGVAGCGRPRTTPRLRRCPRLTEPAGPDAPALSTPTGTSSASARWPPPGQDLAGEARLVDAMVDRGARILDAGCGPGRVGAELHARGHRVVGVDVDPMLIDAARTRPPGPAVARRRPGDARPRGPGRGRALRRGGAGRQRDAVPGAGHAVRGAATGGGGRVAGRVRGGRVPGWRACPLARVRRRRRRSRAPGRAPLRHVAARARGTTTPTSR